MLPIVIKLDGNVIPVRLSQFSNALLAIVFVPSLMVYVPEIFDFKSTKCFPIYCTPYSSNPIEVFSKAYSPILVTLSGIVILSAKEQFLKAYAGMVVSSVIVMFLIVVGI